MSKLVENMFTENRKMSKEEKKKIAESKKVESFSGQTLHGAIMDVIEDNLDRELTDFEYKQLYQKVVNLVFDIDKLNGRSTEDKIKGTYRESIKKKVNESESSDEIDSMFDATWDHLPSSVKSRMDNFWSGRLSTKASAKWFNGYLTALVDLGVITEDEAANVNKMNEFYGNYRTESVKKKVNEAITKDNFRVQTVGFDILTPDENIKVGPDSPFVRKLSSALDEVGYELIDPYSFEIEDVTEYYNEDDLFFEESIKKKVNEALSGQDLWGALMDVVEDNLDRELAEPEYQQLTQRVANLVSDIDKLNGANQKTKKKGQ